MEHDETVLWVPPLENQRTSQMAKFREVIRKKYELKLVDYQELHDWSVKEKELFWSELIDFYNVIYEGPTSPSFTAQGFEAYGWFPHVKLNLAENLLRERPKEEETLRFIHESGDKASYSYSELKSEVARFAAYINDFIGEGDVLAAYMPNLPETLIAMLAATSRGGVFTSTSSDFGVEGVVDRFSQARPKVLIAASSYQYNGKTIDNLDNIKQLEQRLPELEKIIVVDFLGSSPDLSSFKKAVHYEQAIDHAQSVPELEFTRVTFDSPSYIMYSSGTTGKPKCIVHTVGGVLLQHLKELGLHVDLRPKDNILYFTTCGWMMWNWLVSSLYFKGVTTLYEGSPAAPTLLDFMKIIRDEKVTVFGTSPKFLKALEERVTQKLPRFPKLRTILSTGAPLLPEQFDYVYSSIKKTVQLSSICGGTDILGCFMLGCPIVPVHRGEIQSLGLGMDVACYSDEGEELIDEEGELVCRESFPSRPLCFLGDDLGDKMNAAYFERFPGVWHHGDFITLTDRKSVKVFGRSDTTLNPGGVRIGTAEIYRQTERISFIEDSLCVGRPHNGDVDVVLFVKLKPGEELDDDRIDEIKKTIRSQTTPRHVPKEVHWVSDIPYTRSGKKMELPVTRLLSGRELTNKEAVVNPEGLEQYKKFSL